MSTTFMPTHEQIEVLLNFIENHRELARGQLRTIEGILRCQRLWSELTNTLNAMGGEIKSIKQWQRVWVVKKYCAKKKAAAARRSAQPTGGGPSSAPQLTEIDHRIIKIMREGYGHPGTTISVPPAALERSSLSTLREFQEPTQSEVSPSPEQPPMSPEEIHHQLQINRSGQIKTDNSTISRLYRIEEQRLESDSRRNVELATIRVAITQLCDLVGQLVEEIKQSRVLFNQERRNWM